MENNLLALQSKIFDLIKYGTSGELCMYLKKNFRDIHLREPINNMTPLALALAMNKNDMASVLMEYEVPLNIKDSYGWIPFHHACSRGNYDVARQILKQKRDKVDPNTQTATGNCPIHLAAQEGHLEIVELLILNGADPYSKNESRRTPLILALQYCRDDVVEFLEKYKPKEVDYSDERIFSRLPRPPYNPSYIASNPDNRIKQKLRDQAKEMMKYNSVNKPPQPEAYFRTVSENNDRNMHQIPPNSFPGRPPQFYASNSVNSIAPMNNTGQIYYHNSINNIENQSKPYQNLQHNSNEKTNDRRASFTKELYQLAGMMNIFSDMSNPQDQNRGGKSTEKHGQNTYDSSSLPYPTALFSTNNDHSGYSSAEISQNFDQGSYQNDQHY